MYRKGLLENAVRTLTWDNIALNSGIMIDRIKCDVLGPGSGYNYYKGNVKSILSSL